MRYIHLQLTYLRILVGVVRTTLSARGTSADLRRQQHLLYTCRKIAPKTVVGCGGGKLAIPRIACSFVLTPRGGARARFHSDVLNASLHGRCGCRNRVASCSVSGKSSARERAPPRRLNARSAAHRCNKRSFTFFIQVAFLRF